jgi:hypothetical protein
VNEATNATLWKRLEGVHREMAALEEERAALAARVEGMGEEVCVCVRVLCVCVLSCVVLCGEGDDVDVRVERQQLLA